jgi:hypothetical protein
MASIKLTPLFLFLIMIVVLVISYIFGYKSEEGFVSYNQNQGSMYTVMIPFYSCNNTTTKIYDNLYFDPINANLIEIDSNAFTGNIESLNRMVKSDGVSNSEMPWYQIIKNFMDTNYTDNEFLEKSLKYNHNKPYDKESLYYIEIFESYYPNRANTIPYFWKQPFMTGDDPSAWCVEKDII